MIDKIKAEADAIVCEKEQRINVLEQELAEALAQNERSRSVVEEYHSENIACEEAMNELVFMLKQPESTALAALKAEWQAEAIESILNLDHGYMQFEDGSFAYTEESISGYAESIRQRAQEADDE